MRLTRRRMALPWERVKKSYRFEGPKGALSLADPVGVVRWKRFQFRLSSVVYARRDRRRVEYPYFRGIDSCRISLRAGGNKEDANLFS
jgi:hypothetical protein